MRKISLLVFLTVISAVLLCAEEYPLGPDSQRQPGIPKGTVTKYSWTTSKIFPGTTRDYWIYVPAQYKAEKPACVMIFQDGKGMVDEAGSFRVPIVFDNLIQKGDMPVTIGVFINPGIMTALGPNQQNRFNRSFEYDALGDRYASFLIEEILPEVGKRYNLSKDPNDYAIAGSSSGGIAAFNTAWNRPDAFRRVMSFIGSFTNVRGGQDLATLIRKTEPKPLRVFLQDGSADLNIYAGNWFLGNQEIFSALQFAGYESTFTIGTEGHNGKHGGAILPDALRWLWKDYPKPVAKPTQVNERGVYTILEPGKEWELLGEGYGFADGPAVDKDGNVFFTDSKNKRIHKIDANGKISVWKEDSGGVTGMMFGPDGRLYVCQGTHIVAYTPDGKESVLAEDVDSNDLAVTLKNEVYFTDPPGHRVWFIDAKGNKRVVYTGIEFPNGVRTSPDQSLLLVDDTHGKWVWSFQIQPDGSLENGQPFYRMETPDDSSQSGADGMTLDTEGFLYVTTRLGVQICDQPGRVAAIINKPQGKSLSNIVFGGPDMQWLYVTNRDKVYRRHMKRKGVVSWNLVMPPVPRL
ncbi:MAG TPA: SMP-30/gluconolactonase/LRE family protein [Terriglobales bacterium]|nr:SMP-30/gluconolactonase/LRE family protein [Terriglobales bacterium]